MEIKQLEYFRAVVESGTISAAARKLSLSQPPLSFQMKKLEDELGLLLFERGIDKFCNKILVVISDYEVQLNRIVERDKIDRELASKIIKSQLSNEERIKKADVVIENNSNLEDLFKKVERFCETI